MMNVGVTIPATCYNLKSGTGAAAGSRQIDARIGWFNDGLMPKHGQWLCFRRVQILKNTIKPGTKQYGLKRIHRQVCRSSGTFQPPTPTHHNGHLVTIIPCGRREIEWNSSIDNQVRTQVYTHIRLHVAYMSWTIYEYASEYHEIYN